MTIRTVLFDLDETLFDHTHAARSGLSALRDRHDTFGRMSLEELEAESQRLLDEVHPRVLQGLITIDEARAERFQRLCDFCGARVTADEVDQLTDLYRSTYSESRRPVPGSAELLEALHQRVRIGIVSNNLTEEQREKLQVTGIDRLIDFLVTSEDAGVEKPDPGIFLEALRHAACSAEEAVMVGDSWRSDVLGARDAGIRAVWFNRRRLPCPDPSLAHEIHSFEPVENLTQMLLNP